MSPPRIIRTLAWLVVAFLGLIGLTGLVAPATFTLLMAATISTTGLYSVGAIRLGVGVVLFRVAPVTRAPTLIRVLGVLIFLGGLGTFLIGLDRAKAIEDWLNAGGPIFMRVVGAVALLIAGALGYALSNRQSRALK